MADEPIEGDGNVLNQYHKQKLIEELKGFMRDVQDGLNDRGEPVKTIPMRPEWQAAWDELQKITAEHTLIDRKHRTQKDYFWALVHKGLEDFRSMRYNPKTKEIEIFEEDESHEE